MTTTIKITELTNIGANLASSTVIPVVNMAGTPTTEKAVLGNVANFILAGAGGNYVAAAVATTATTANTVLTNAQPNITSVGTLTSLSVTGNITSGNANLGNTVTANYFIGSGANLSNIPGANVSGNVANATYSISAGTAGTVTTNAQPNVTSMGNLTGLTVSNATGIVNFSNTANVSLGNISNLHITGGSNGQVLTSNGSGNLSWTTVSGGANTGNISFNNNVIYSNTGVVVNNSDLGNGQTAGMSIPVQGDGNAVALYNSYGGVNLLAGNIGNSQTVQAWTFGADGNLTVPGGILGAGNLKLSPDLGNANSYLDIFLTSGPDLHLVASNGANLILGEDNQANIMTSWNGNAYVQSWDSNTNTQGGVWTFGGDGALTLPNDANIATIGNVTQFNTCTNGFLSLNSYDAGGNNIASLAVNSIDGLVGISTHDTATDSDYQWGFNITGGTIFPTLTVDLHNGGNQTAQTLQFGDPTQQAIITGPTPSANVNAQRLIVQGQRGTGGEGGDVYVWGGDSDINGGDIKIYAGDSDGATGSGGYINLAGGAGADNAGYINLDGGYSANGYGGYVNITGGSSGSGIGGNIQIQAGQSGGGNINGANILLQGGYSQTANGGAITVRGGQSALGLSGYGNVLVEAGTSQWKFDNTGNLSVPGNLIGPDNANFTIYSNVGQHEFVFGDDGTFYAPDDAVLGGNTIYIGPAANTLAGLEHAVLIASSNHFAYIQGVINNISDNGSADWVAQGRLGSDEGGWADFGFTSGGFNDANYTITGPGDGYLLVESYAPGQLITGPKGGNLILATGSQGTVRDIIFGTGGFETGNIFGRMSDANNSFELSRTGATITFPDATEQNTAWTGSLTTIANGNSNVSIPTANGNINFTSTGNANVVVITGTGANISGTLNATGNISANYFIGNGSQLTGVATQVTGTWTVPVGNSTQSFTVSSSGTYSMWVDCNITNGILAWNATATVTNTNVPVVGAQYAWVYSGGGTPIDFTSIPNQFVGTGNTIVRSSVAPSATTNRFDFGLNNTSGGNVTVRYGWVAIS